MASTRKSSHALRFRLSPLLSVLFLLTMNRCHPVDCLNPTFTTSKKINQMSFKTKKELPEKLVVGYTTNHCHDLNAMAKEIQAVKDGVNVLIWSFIQFEVVKKEESIHVATLGKDKTIRIKVSQNIENYKKFKDTLVSMGYDSIVHLVAFGGWNGSHLPSGFSAEELYRVFQSFNTPAEGENNEEQQISLWDGIDWDLEGHDHLEHPNNEFSVELLDQVGEFSQLAKIDGLIVSMAPPESYLDITTHRFSRFVNLTYPDDPWHQDFEYHGWNVYAFVLAKYGHSIDFVFLQFYESWSHALYQTEQLGMSQSAFLVEFVTNLSRNGRFGYDVNFEDDPTVGLKNQFVELPLSKIVFGFANGWALESEKAIFFNPNEIKLAYDKLKNKNLDPRGCGYWVVDEEGKHGINLTKALRDILASSTTERTIKGRDIQCNEEEDIRCME